MNYALFSEYVRDIQAELATRFGVPSKEAAAIAQYIEVAAISAEAKERKDNQLVMDFKEHGAKALAERHGVSDRTVREWRSQILRKKIGMESAA